MKRSAVCCQIIPTGHDYSVITSNDPTPDPAEPSFRRYIAARRARDERGAAQAWYELLEFHLGRVRVWVAAFDFGGRNQRIPEHEREDAVQDAVIRATDMFATWEGHHLGQWRKALRTATWNSCADHMRRHITRDRRQEGSFDEHAYDGEGGDQGRFDNDLADKWSADDFDHELDTRAVFAQLVDRISDLPNPNHRVVLIMTMDGHDSKTIAEHLGTTPNNVDQMRRRAIKALENGDDDSND